MKKRRLVWVMVFWIVAIQGKAQYLEVARSARPGKIPGAFTIGKNVWQIQGALEIGSLENVIAHYTNLPFIVRYGTSERVEVRMGFNYRFDHLGDQNATSVNGISNFIAGIRINLRESLSTGPTVALQLHYRINALLSEPYERNHPGPEIFLVIHQRLSSKSGIFLAIGPNWNGITAEPQWQFGPRYAFVPRSNIRLMVEYIGRSYNSLYLSELRTGSAFVLNRNLIADISGGFSWGEETSDFSLNAGFTWRIPPANRQ